jgi:hypothetical protein
MRAPQSVVGAQSVACAWLRHSGGRAAQLRTGRAPGVSRHRSVLGQTLALRWASGSPDSAGRVLAFCLVIAGAALMPAPMRASPEPLASKRGCGPGASDSTT